jgi:succinate-semialdehyde dehydrogenase/glutarate-semialdehyde dehydrogenase
MRLMQEETFGPVIAIANVADAEEAVRMVNDSDFALSASIWTRDNKRACLLASQIHAGAVMINDTGSYFGIAEAPHGGYGASGWGRTHARIGLMEMVRVKYIDIDQLPGWPKPWWFGYNGELSERAERLIEFLYAPTWRERLRSAVAATRLLFRGHRI